MIVRRFFCSAISMCLNTGFLCRQKKSSVLCTVNLFSARCPPCASFRIRNWCFLFCNLMTSQKNYLLLFGSKVNKYTCEPRGTLFYHNFRDVFRFSNLRVMIVIDSLFLFLFSFLKPYIPWGLKLL